MAHRATVDARSLKDGRWWFTGDGFVRTMAQPALCLALALASVDAACASDRPPASLAGRPAPGRATADARRYDAPQAAAYRQALAQRVHAANAEWLYAGRPPNPLYSVVVMQLRVDASGRLAEARLVRSNGHAHLQRRALDSLRRAQPLPVPPDGMLRGSAWLTETWLFDRDGRFQLRTLALPQLDTD